MFVKWKSQWNVHGVIHSFVNAGKIIMLELGYAFLLGKVRFLLGEGGVGHGFRGEGHSLFWQGKITPCRFYFVYNYKQSYQSRLI